MVNYPPFQVQRYGTAILLVGSALLLTLGLDPWLGMTKTPFLLFFGALTVSAWYGGRGAGVFATLLSALLAGYFFVHPMQAFELAFADSIRILIFALQGILISCLCGALRIVPEHIQASLQQLQAPEPPFQPLVGSNNIGAEAALRESEARLQAIIDNATTLIYMKDREGRYLLVNRQFEEAFQVNPQAFLGHTDDDFFPPAIANALKANDQQVFAGKAIEVEEVVTHADGPHTYLSIKFPLYDASGQIYASCGISTDIHARKRTEEALRRSEQLYRAIGETIDYGIWVCEPDGRNTYVSESFLRLVGMTQEECANFGWEKVLHPDDAEQTIAAWKECAQSGELWDKEHRFRGVDGQWHPILARGVPVRDQDGKIICWAGINLDISRQKRVEAELRQSEERFRLATRAVAGIVYDWNLQTNQVYRSEGLYSLLGVRPDQISTDQSWWSDRIHPEDLAEIEPIYQELLSGSRDRYDFEYRVRHEDGHWVNLWDQGYLIRDEQGQVLRVVGSSTDITDRKRAEAEREKLLASERAAREEAEAANRIKDEFLAVLSHELRSPLNPILGWIQLLRTRTLDEQTTNRALETIERNAKLQTQLIEDLLDVSRILRGKLSLNIRPVNLANIVDAAIETVRLSAEAKGIQLQTYVDANLETIFGDPNRLQQIVWNLLSNAIKFTPNGGQVDVRLQQMGLDAQIRVKDTGRGIHSDFLPYVFEYFRQADSSTTRSSGGLGLGLAIVRHLVELHGGTVQADSPGEDQGATFVVRLPRMVTGSTPQDIHQPATVRVDFSGLRILMVDDEADMRDLGIVILREYGASVETVTSAAEALLALEQFKPDILISDIGMPEVDGYAFMRQVRARPPEQYGQIPAIALTAYAGEFNQQQAFAAGFQIHIAKPVSPEELVQAIARLTNRIQSDPNI